MVTIDKYVKKPIIIKAVCWDGSDEAFNAIKYIANNARYTNAILVNDVLTIKTLEGDMIANKGDYVIQGVSGEVYPCKPDIFAKTYDKVKE